MTNVSLINLKTQGDNQLFNFPVIKYGLRMEETRGIGMKEGYTFGCKVNNSLITFQVGMFVERVATGLDQPRSSQRWTMTRYCPDETGSTLYNNIINKFEFYA